MHLAARGVDEHGAGLERGAAASASTKPRVSLRQRQVHADDVGARDDGFGIVDDLDAEVLTAWRARVGVVGEAPAPDDDRHAEGARPARHFLPDVAEADQAERPAEQPLRLRELLLVPVALRAARATLSGMRRSSASISANASSATATAFLPGQFDT